MSIINQGIEFSSKGVVPVVQTGEWVSLTVEFEAERNRIHFINSEKMVKAYYFFEGFGFEWLATTTNGAIIIVDSAMPEQFRGVKSLLEDYRALKVEYSASGGGCQLPTP